MQPLPVISRGRSLKENAQKLFGFGEGFLVWGFFICLFCEGEEISKIIQEKHDSFQLKKKKVVTL